MWLNYLFYIEDSSSEATSSEMLFRRSFYDGTELESIDESDPMRFCYVSTVHAPVKTMAGGKPGGEDDEDACIIGQW